MTEIVELEGSFSLYFICNQLAKSINKVDFWLHKVFKTQSREYYNHLLLSLNYVGIFMEIYTLPMFDWHKDFLDLFLGSL